MVNEDTVNSVDERLRVLLPTIIGGVKHTNSSPPTGPLVSPRRVKGGVTAGARLAAWHGWQRLLLHWLDQLV